MKPLSEALTSISFSAMQEARGRSTSQHGLTRTDGKTNTQNQLAVRQHQLTESQLTQIASKLLHKPLVVSCRKEKVYGRKTFSDDFGEYVVDDQLIGEEEVFHIDVPINRNADPKWFESAIRHSPPSSTITHLSRLSLHKRLGSSDQDRSILLHDYAEALREFSEFVVFVACRHFWENDKGGFYPKIAALKQICKEIDAAIRSAYTATMPAIEDKRDEERERQNQEELEQLRRLAELEKQENERMIAFLVKATGRDESEFRTGWYDNYRLSMVASAHGYSEHAQDKDEAA